MQPHFFFKDTYNSLKQSVNFSSSYFVRKNINNQLKFSILPRPFFRFLVFFCYQILYFNFIENIPLIKYQQKPKKKSFYSGYVQKFGKLLHVLIVYTKGGREKKNHIFLEPITSSLCSEPKNVIYVATYECRH